MGLRSLFTKNRDILLYGAALALLLLLMQWMEARFLVRSRSTEIYIGLIALVFTGLGIWLALKLARPKKETIIIKKEILIPAQKEFSLNEAELERLSISKRELEVLQLIAEGLSNAGIAERLFVSLNTVKTHSSKLFEKLEVKRRTQAVEVGKRLGLIG